MALSIAPLATILAAVAPHKFAVPVFFVVSILTNESPTVRPRENALAMHSIIFPLTFVCPAIGP